MLGEVNNEILNAINLLRLSDVDIKLLDNQKGEVIYKECLNHFVRSGDRRWWWEDFKLPSFTFTKFDLPFNQLNEILPETDGNVWFMVEDDHELFYPIYDTNPEVIKSVIAKCFGFEYYIIEKDKQWLLCETHHNDLIGIGDKLRDKNINIINL